MFCNVPSAFITLTLSSSFDARPTGASKQSGTSSICKAIQRVRSKVAVISKTISNVCLYGNLDIRCRLDYEVGIAHLILHQYPQAHLYSGVAYLLEHSKFSATSWHPGARHGRLFRNNFVRPLPLFRRIPKARRAKCNLTPSWLSVSVSPFLARATLAAATCWAPARPTAGDNSRGRTPFSRY